MSYMSSHRLLDVLKNHLVFLQDKLRSFSEIFPDGSKLVVPFRAPNVNDQFVVHISTDNISLRIINSDLDLFGVRFNTKQTVSSSSLNKWDFCIAHPNKAEEIWIQISADGHERSHFAYYPKTDKFPESVYYKRTDYETLDSFLFQQQMFEGVRNQDEIQKDIDTILDIQSYLDEDMYVYHGNSVIFENVLPSFINALQDIKVF